MKIDRAYSRLKYESQSDAGSSTASKQITQKLRDATGMPRLSTRKVRRWLREGLAKRMGRSVNINFEKQVLDELMFTQVPKVENEEQAAVVANVSYSHDCIVQAANLVRQRSEWSKNPKVSALKLSRSWVRGWLRRSAMRPRSARHRAVQGASPAGRSAEVHVRHPSRH